MADSAEKRQRERRKREKKREKAQRKDDRKAGETRSYDDVDGEKPDEDGPAPAEGEEKPEAERP